MWICAPGWNQARNAEWPTHRIHCQNTLQEHDYTSSWHGKTGDQAGETSWLRAGLAKQYHKFDYCVETVTEKVR